MRDLGEAVQGRLLERTVDQEAVVMADESERDDADRFKDAL